MRYLLVASALLLAAACSGSNNTFNPDGGTGANPDGGTTTNPDGGTDAGTNDGQHIFRFDTFGDEDFWGGTLRLHE
ncbi:MAG TPA: hypothetical protein VE620_01860, partial [Myxococcales bacterium]|nr:hypothetical protein [Myxococcales bacterium]